MELTLLICSAPPANLAAAMTLSLGVKKRPPWTIEPPLGIRLAQFDGGDVLTSGIATHFALVDLEAGVLVKVAELTAPVPVQVGESFSLSPTVLL